MSAVSYQNLKSTDDVKALEEQELKDYVMSPCGYLSANRMFIHSTPSKGVNIASLRDHYWAEHFVVARRVKVVLATNQQVSSAKK